MIYENTVVPGSWMESIVGNHAPLSSLFAKNTKILQISLDIIMLLPLLVKNANNSSCLYGLFLIKNWKRKRGVGTECLHYGLVRKHARISGEECWKIKCCHGNRIPTHPAMQGQKTGSFQIGADRTSSSSWRSHYVTMRFEWTDFPSRTSSLPSHPPLPQ